MQNYKVENVSEINGYRIVYVPTYPREKGVRGPGWFYEHKKKKKKELGRFLTNDEVVHHLDENTLNNHPSNLIVLDRKHHGRLHAWAEGRSATHVTNQYCTQCGLTLGFDQSMYCSHECRKDHLASISKRPTKEILEGYVNESVSYSSIGRIYGVSSNSVRKWCKSYGIEKKLKQEREKTIAAPRKVKKLTPEQVQFIRDNYIPGDREMGARGMGRRFDVNHGTILDIMNGFAYVNESVTEEVID
mgnify:FL=1